MSATLLQEMTQRIDERMDELKPLVEEFTQLEDARARLTGKGVTTSLTPTRRGRPPAGPNAPSRGKRTEQIKAYLREHSDGVTLNDIMENTGISQNYAYRLVRELIGANLARRERGLVYFLAENDTEPKQSSEDEGEDTPDEGEDTEGTTDDEKPEEESKPKARARTARR